MRPDEHAHRRGQSQRVNWLATDHDDIEKALWFLQRTPHPLRAREIVELRSRSLLSTRWPQLLSLATLLQERGVLLGSEVEEHLRGKVRLARDKPVDPSARHAAGAGRPSATLP